MICYSVVKVGTEYVVKVGDQGVLKLASRRKAAKLVLDLLDRQAQTSANENSKLGNERSARRPNEELAAHSGTASAAPLIE